MIYYIVLINCKFYLCFKFGDMVEGVEKNIYLLNIVNLKFLSSSYCFLINKSINWGKILNKKMNVESYLSCLLLG